MTSILNLTPSNIATRCIVVGDPKRSKDISLLLDDCVRICKKREYYIYTGYYNNIKVSVASHGVGAAGSNVLFSELIQVGVSIIIRAGTCGSYKDLPQGSIIIVNSAVRNDGASDQLIPLSYPASSHYEIVSNLVNVSNSMENIVSYVGICNTIANLYDGVLDSNKKLWAKANVLAEDMETSSLLTIGNLKNIKTGAILTVDCFVFQDKESEYFPNTTKVKEGINNMIKITLETIIKIK